MFDSLNQPSLYLLLHRLWSHIAPRRRSQFGALFFLMIAASFAEVVSIGAVLPFLATLTSPESVFRHPIAQPAINFFGLTAPGQLLLPLTVLFAFTAIISGAIRLVLLWAQTKLGHAIGADLSISIYRRTLYQPYSVHVARNSSEVIAGISGKANGVVYFTLLPLLTILSSIVILTTILFALLAIEPFIASVAFAGFGAIYALVIMLTRKRLARDSQRVSHEQTQVIKALQDGLGGIRDVLIDGTQSTYCKIYRKADLSLRQGNANIQMIASSPRYGIEALGMVLIAMLAFVLAGRSAGIATAIPVLGALALAAQRMLPALQQTYSCWASLRGGQASLADALVLLDQPLPSHADGPLPTPSPFQDAICFNNLSFRYTPQGPWVLRGLDFTIPKGSRIGFIGTTGSGKSTLLDIVMGLLSPTEGSFSIDSNPVTERNCRAWQTHIAHVPQVIFLSDTTIAENIAFGVEPDQIDHARVRWAAEKAQIALTIESWNFQYDTVVGERGIRLSGGQRQRIGIARALYKKADVIVLDEATSALDNDTEFAVMEAIDNLGSELTVLIVAHRLTTLRNCDWIVELGNGSVSRIGTYQEIVGNQSGALHV
jgi:ABC-type multidrug transport system fused ATPase/permease subunit